MTNFNREAMNTPVRSVLTHRITEMELAVGAAVLLALAGAFGLGWQMGVLHRREAVKRAYDLGVRDGLEQNKPGTPATNLARQARRRRIAPTTVWQSDGQGRGFRYYDYDVMPPQECLEIEALIRPLRLAQQSTDAATRRQGDGATTNSITGEGAGATKETP